MNTSTYYEIRGLIDIGPDGPFDFTYTSLGFVTRKEAEKALADAKREEGDKVRKLYLHSNP